MAANGNEVVKLSQLKTYVKYASDEEFDTWLNSSDETSSVDDAVLTAAQLKKLIESGGSSSSGGWTTVYEGQFTCDHYESLDMFFNPNDYSKIRITAQYSRYGVFDSGTFEFNLPGLTSSDTVIGAFDLSTSNFTYTVTGSMLYGTVSLVFSCSNYSYLTYCTITKVEVM